MAPQNYIVADLLGLALALLPYNFILTPLDKGKALNEPTVALYQAGKAGAAIRLAPTPAIPVTPDPRFVIVGEGGR